MKNKIDVYVGGGHDLKTAGKRSPKYHDGSFMKEIEHNDPVENELVRLFKKDDRFSVFNTSPGTIYKSLADRVRSANDLYILRGKKYNSSVYISVHANASKSIWNSASGTETLYNKGSRRGREIAKVIQKNLVQVFKSRDRGIKERTGLYILRKTLMPAVITEALFMTNKEDMKKLLSKEYRMKEAYSTYKSLCEFFNFELIKEIDINDVVLKVDPLQKEELIVSSKLKLSKKEIVDILSADKFKEKKEKKEVKELTIYDIQKKLNENGYYCGNTDGNKGPKTKAAILAFKRLNNLKVNDFFDEAHMKLLEGLKSNNNDHKTVWFNNCEVHLYVGDLNKYEVGVDYGIMNKLEKLSKMASEYAAAINGQFFGGGRVGLGTLITKGLYFFKPQNDLFTNWIQYKDNKVEVRDVKDSELYLLQRNTNFVIGTSWPLIVDGKKSTIKFKGINHKHFKHPRTLLNQTEDNSIVLITVDGRSKISKGMTAKQCQELLDYIEEVFGIKIIFSVNLDGGGSTEMLVNGEIVNVVSSGSERKIGTFVYLKRRK